MEENFFAQCVSAPLSSSQALVIIEYVRIQMLTVPFAKESRAQCAHVMNYSSRLTIFVLLS